MKKLFSISLVLLSVLFVSQTFASAGGVAELFSQVTMLAESGADAASGVATKEEASLWAMIVAAVGGALLALVTPCVFPMIPMTVSFFIKGHGTKAKGRLMAMLFGISIVALYTLPIAILILIARVVGGDAVTADIFNWLATHWIPNIIFFLVFMIFAASFFGAFEIVLPSWMVNKSDEQSDKGGFVGVFFMALTLVLVSFSCTGPIVGTILVEATSGTGNILRPIIIMFAFSLTFAIPFTIFAFFPSLLKNMPKSGGWLNTVKVVLGFVEVALGLKFLSVADQAYGWGILDREVYIAIWIVTFALLGLYLLGKIRFAHDDVLPAEKNYVRVPRLFMAIGVFAFVVYLVPGMWGAPLKALAGYLPPLHTIDFQITGGGAATADGATDESHAGQAVSQEIPLPENIRFSDILFHPQGLHGFFDLKEATEYAKKVNKPLFVDFTGHGCVNCRAMEQQVLSDERVKKLINEKFVFVSLFVDDKRKLPEDEWVVSSKGRTLKTIGKINADYQAVKYNSNSQPYYLVTDTDSDATTLGGPIAMEKDIEKFIKFLEDGLAAYNKKNNIR